MLNYKFKNLIKKKKIKILIICRSKSKRFPNKIKKKINNLTMIDILILRLLKVFNSSDIIVCTSVKEKKKFFLKLKKKYKINIFFGSDKNVLKRIIDTSKKFNAKNIIRITGDNPLTDIKTMQKMIEKFSKKNLDYMYTNSLFPGLRSEIFNLNALIKCLSICEDPLSSEYLTYFFLRKKIFKIFCFKQQRFNFEKNLSITIDKPSDFKMLSKIINKKGIFLNKNDLILELPKKK
tara:strand:- start:3916 stop:4620 length:705 start_codon:yes stop_codon:yes gene_type:complete